MQGAEKCVARLRGRCFFGKKPQLFPLSPYLHLCIIPYYRAFGQSVFSNSDQNRPKIRQKQRRNRFHLNFHPWSKFTVSLRVCPKKSPEPSGSGDFKAFWQALAPALSFRAMLFFLGAKVLLWAFPETKFCPCARSSAEAPVNFDRQFGPPGHRFPVYPCMFLNPVKASEACKGQRLGIM